jgi:hypothetical protein
MFVCVLYRRLLTSRALIMSSGIEGDIPGLISTPDGPETRAGDASGTPASEESGHTVFRPVRASVHLCDEANDAEVFKRYGQAKLAKMREALTRLDRQANERRVSGTGRLCEGKG